VTKFINGPLLYICVIPIGEFSELIVTVLLIESTPLISFYMYSETFVVIKLRLK